MVGFDYTAEQMLANTLSRVFASHGACSIYNLQDGMCLREGAAH